MQLLKSGDISVLHAREAVDLWEKQKESEMLWRVLARHPRVDRDAVFRTAASTYAFPAEAIDPDAINTAFVKQTVESLTPDQQDRMLAFRLLPLRHQEDAQRGIKKLVFATHDPMKPEAFRLMQEAGVQHFELRYAPEAEVADLLDELFPRRNEYLERIEADESAQAFDFGASYEEQGSRLIDEDQLEAEINRSALINLFEATLVEGVRAGASDVHIFPNEQRQTEFHMRVDGVLKLWHTQDKVHPESMLAVVKDRCMNVDRFDRDAAQDGYIQRNVDNKLIRFRVSILPIATADREVKSESIVIRILDDSKVFTDLSAINLHPTALKRFEKAVSQPHGMVIMTGPTGSGKSTTLAAALHGVISPQRNVLTVEDPVEYIIRGARQIKLGPRLNLESALRSILRHDPDVVMVGEMRDRPTAELAIKLANTGHLTFSTLHTNDAPSAVSRLFKMGVEPFLIGYAINLVVAQRLLRKLCPTCREVESNPDRVLLRELGFTDEEIAGMTLYRAGHSPNCRTCGGQGYKGRQAIAEALYFSRAIRHLIVEAGSSIDEDAIRDTAIAEGMLTLQASAREVVKRGESSIDEMIRVVSTE
ncbi:type II secretion system protein E [Longibacter salinarum]|uniref:Type II secretion system protein E n=2 Tax=Longibacter salinarum TaxID=1850348 RepID=A0A2A8CUS2_9BACT|nr:type II secretion system protein E [Longibacter salinarum]